MMNQNKKNKNKVEEVEVELTMDEIKALKVKFATLTEISDKLLSGGEVNIYQVCSVCMCFIFLFKYLLFVF